MLKTYYERENTEESRPVTMCTSAPSSEELLHVNVPKVSNSEILKDLDRYLAHLDEEKLEPTKKLIIESKRIFSDHPMRTTWIEHDVEVQNHRPIKQSPYRENPMKKEKIRKELQYMIDQDIIEESHSEWSSPCLIVPKPDGSSRFCTDYRKVNSVTTADSYPLPRIDDCVELVGQSKFISKFDLLKGYYQVPLTKQAKKISAFTTCDGLWQYKVMPFGMRNAAATFQRLANKVVDGLEGCTVYVDDIIVYSNTWPEHINRLGKLFKRLEEANLTVSMAKSEIGKESLNYLGFNIGNSQIKPVVAKLKNLLDFPAPTNKKELRRFLGMAGYYRKFCKNYSLVVLPLTQLTSPKVKFAWTAECQYAFEQTKTMLTSPPILVMPLFDRPYHLMVDASELGIGAVLSQFDDKGIEHPVSFFSKKFNKAQLNYSTIEKEMLAILLSLKHYAYYLKSGHCVQVYTDHNPLVFIHKMKNENQRLLRWSLQIQEFELNIQHIKGKNNMIADCLSRSPDWTKLDS